MPNQLALYRYLLLLALFFSHNFLDIRAKPMYYLDWLLGHEGKGSILSYLKKK
jgi:secreted Zn-dependent insulinase-like peptidase